MPSRNDGFTLIEVLIALAILAIALVALIKVAGQSVAEAASVKEKMSAHWVAMNALAKMQTGLIDLNKTTDPSGDEKMLGAQWHWQAAIQQGSSKVNFVQVKITVQEEPSKKTFETLTGFVRLQHETS